MEIKLKERTPEAKEAYFQGYASALRAAKEAVGNVTISACDMLGGYELLSGSDVKKKAVSAIDALEQGMYARPAK